MSKAASWLKDNFGKADFLVRSPGRINLIGEHIDYTGGHMMPTAIQLGMDLAVRKNDRKEVRLFSLNFQNGTQINLETFMGEPPLKGWAAYPGGVFKEWKARKLPLQGFDICIHADLPNGAGLSSSAALTCGLAFSLNALSNVQLAPMELAEIARDAERKHAGVQCGWMDQVAVLFSESGKWLHFDARDMRVEKLPIPNPPPQFILLDTGVKHSLASSAYNQRVAECASIFQLLGDHFPFFQHIRDFNPASLPELQQLLPKVLYKRLQHMLSENERVSKVLDVFRKPKEAPWTEIGHLLTEGHASLSKAYEVSCDETDYLVEQCKNMPGCYGARMMGGGFGGVVLALLDPDYQTSDLRALQIRYEKRFYQSLQYYPVLPSEACHLL
jgi:galactokinase